MSKLEKIDLNEYAGGALQEYVSIEIQRVMDNIADPNTDFKQKRKMTLTLTFESNENRDVTTVDIQAKSTLASMKSVGTTMLIGRDGQGNVLGKELKSGVPGQVYLDEKGEVRHDTGEKVGDEDTPPPAASNVRKIEFN